MTHHPRTILVHPALPDRELEVRESAAPIHKLSGWRRQDDPITPIALDESGDQSGQENGE